MSMSVCMSIREDISGTTGTLFNKFFVCVAYVRGSVLLRHVDKAASHIGRQGEMGVHVTGEV